MLPDLRRKILEVLKKFICFMFKQKFFVDTSISLTIFPLFVEYSPSQVARHKILVVLGVVLGFHEIPFKVLGRKFRFPTTDVCFRLFDEIVYDDCVTAELVS